MIRNDDRIVNQSGVDVLRTEGNPPLMCLTRDR